MTPKQVKSAVKLVRRALPKACLLYTSRCV